MSIGGVVTCSFVARLTLCVHLDSCLTVVSKFRTRLVLYRLCMGWDINTV